MKHKLKEEGNLNANTEVQVAGHSRAYPHRRDFSKSESLDHK